MALVNYHDAIMYVSDANILRQSNAWLNDQCINFACKLFEHDRDYMKINGPSGARFIDPSVVSFMKLQCEDDDEFQDLAFGMDLKDSDYIVFLPINDSDSLLEASCSHWSLLIIFSFHSIAYHVDSYHHNQPGAGKQLDQATKTAQSFSKLLKW